MSLDPTLLTFLQWLVSQGIGVAVAVAVLWLVGRKVDQQTVALGALTSTIATLAAMIEPRVPPR